MKALKPGDFKQKDVVTNRQFTLSETSSLLTHAIGEKQIGTFYTGSSPQSNGFYKGSLFGAVKTQFYINQYKPETIQSLGNSFGFLQLSQNTFDEKILEGSVSIVSGSTEILDDELGNLFISGSSNNIGNVFYEHGTLVITDETTYLNTFEGDFNISYRAYHLKSELSFSATIRPNEFNFSTNPTARISGKTTFDRPRFSYTIEDFSDSYGEGIVSQSIIPEFFGLDPSGSIDSRLKPHVTTIGYYNDAGELLAVGKLSSPTPLPDDFPVTFNFDIDV